MHNSNDFLAMIRFGFRHIAVVWSVVVCMAMIAQGCISDGNESADETTLVKIGQQAPDFTVEMLDGSKIHLSELRGEVVLLTFWDPECPTCRGEMAAAPSRIVERIRAAKVNYLPISRGYDRKTIADFCANNEYEFSVGLDPDKKIYSLYATKYVPRSFLIDKRGVIRYLYVEYQLDKLEEILSAAERLAKE